MKEELEFIESIEDVEKNLRHLIKCRNSEIPEDIKFYENRIKSGANFVVMIIDGAVEFAPSRFVGYKNLNRSYYEPKAHEGLHGGPTGQKLGGFFGRIQENELLENFFYQFLNKNIKGGHVPRRAYPFGFFLNQIKLDELEPFIPGIKAGGLQKPIDFDFKQVILRFNEMIKSQEGILKGFEIKHIHDDWVWIGDSEGVIGNQKAHYEIRNMDKTLWVVLHFEGSKEENDLFHQSIEKLPKGLVWTNWWSSKSICIKPYVIKNNDDFIQQLVDQLLLLEESVGNQVRELIKGKGKGMEQKIVSEISLNQILYGPPGTGKTYNTVNKAISIIEPNFDLSQSRSLIMKKYQALIESGNIVFTTFHQSLSYEDFIEGIKPKLVENDGLTDGSDLEYEVGEGILKSMVNQIDEESKAVEVAKDSLFIPKEKFTGEILKISLGNSLDPEDDVIYQYCIENNVIAMGFGEQIDFTGVKNRVEIRERFASNGVEFESAMDFSISAIERFVIWPKKGMLVFASSGTKQLKAIGITEGDYYCDPNTPIRYAQFRKVKWLYVDLELPIKQIYPKLFSQQTIYVMDARLVDSEFFSKKTIKNSGVVKNRVLIIDEINRGNVSAIFGELITLIEEDKRKGKPNELEVILPYSKEKFSVPKNLYIIGTMNTADRSVEALDTALRRRFSFEEMMPRPDLLEEFNVEGIEMSELLQVINKRVEVLIDRDHTIGHSYFMNVDSLDALKATFRDKIIPLLQEYFYGDYGKIGLVLGKSFVNEVTYSSDEKSNLFSDFKYERKQDLIQSDYQLISINEDFDILDAVNTLMNKKESQIDPA